MSHLTRQSVPKSWPIERKGTTYVVKSRVDVNGGVPVLVALRDMLELAQTRREVKKIIHLKQFLINEKPARDEKNSILFLDTVTIVPTKKNYRLELSASGKFYFNEIKETEANKKIAKITNKKVLKGKKTQLNLSDGRNFLSDIKCNMNDSVVVNLKEGKIEKCVPLKEKAKVIIFSGKHVGDKGEIISLNSEEKIAKVKSGNKEINILIKQIIAVE